jgi:hypothetical protein
MSAYATREELLELVDWLWEERHDPVRASRPGVPVSETPLGGWVLDAGLREFMLGRSDREAEAKGQYGRSAEYEESFLTWGDLTEEERNRWRVRAKAPTFPPLRPRPE